MHKFDINEAFMQRCFDLALLGKGKVAPNPMVGACLVYNNEIIGEGYHRKYGESHAEVNAVASVPPSKRHLIQQSTMYVSLEPCNFVGKTPACTSLIIREKIPRVVISALDLTPQVSGNSVVILKERGVEVVTGILEKRGKEIAKVRSVIASKNRPYIFLKFAQSINGYFAPADGSQFWITEPLTKHLTHKWRAEADAIMVGFNTAKNDNPALTNRLFSGNSPLRVVLDRNLSLPSNLTILKDGLPTLIVTESSQKLKNVSKEVHYLLASFNETLLETILAYLYRQNIGVLMVEGGAQLLNSFIKAGLWDDARVLIGQKYLKGGIPAPVISGLPIQTGQFGNDEIRYFQNS